MEEFYQEAGRAGRNPTMQAYSLVYYHGSDASERATDSPMHTYCKGKVKQCRRLQLVHHFDPDAQINPGDNHKCCDICVENCACAECPPLPWKHLDSPTETSGTSGLCCATRDVNAADKEHLLSALKSYKDTSVTDKQSFISGSIMTGITDKVINDIVVDVQHIHQVEDLMAQYVYIRSVAQDIMDIIDITLS
jgi:superfamily II DNA helicase RecQ